MELRVNLAILAALGLVWAALAAGQPVAALDPASVRTRRLADLEDGFARNRDDRATALALAESYLEIHEPGLAIATLRSADPQLLEDPMVSHRLAQAYEQSGRVLDALATADVAIARCARSIGADGATVLTPVPRFECTEGTYAALEMHRAALDRMVRWGVSDPERDPRARIAYDVAVRRARVASF